MDTIVQAKLRRFLNLVYYSKVGGPAPVGCPPPPEAPPAASSRHPWLTRGVVVHTLLAAVRHRCRGSVHGWPRAHSVPQLGRVQGRERGPPHSAGVHSFLSGSRQHLCQRDASHTRRLSAHFAGSGPRLRLWEAPVRAAAGRGPEPQRESAQTPSTLLWSLWRLLHLNRPLATIGAGCHRRPPRPRALVPGRLIPRGSAGARGRDLCVPPTNAGTALLFQYGAI